MGDGARQDCAATSAMADATFQVVFEGRLAEGADRAQVKANVARLFKIDVAKVEPLFSGRRAVVKRRLDEATANRYRDAFEQAGAIVKLVPEGAEEPAAAPPDPRRDGAAPAATPRGQRADAAREGPTRAQIAAAGRVPPPAAARGVPSAPAGMSMAEAGATLVEGPAPVETPDIDTSHLTLAEPGADLAEQGPVAPREFDLSDFELAPPETPLGGPGPESRE
jgi:hypothetical protein